MKERTSLIKLSKKSIYHLYPKVISMDINMTRLTGHRYKSKIVLKTKNKSFFVDKVAQSYKESLDKSCRAIKKQLERAKVDRVHQPSEEAVFEDEIDGMFYTDIGGES